MLTTYCTTDTNVDKITIDWQEQVALSRYIRLMPNDAAAAAAEWAWLQTIDALDETISCFLHSECYCNTHTHTYRDGIPTNNAHLSTSTYYRWVVTFRFTAKKLYQTNNIIIINRSQKHLNANYVSHCDTILWSRLYRLLLQINWSTICHRLGRMYISYPSLIETVQQISAGISNASVKSSTPTRSNDYMHTKQLLFYSNYIMEWMLE